MNISKETWIQGLDAIKNNAYTKTHLDLSGLELGPSEMKDLLPALEANKRLVLPLLSKPIRRPQDNHDARFLENLQREEQKDRLRQMP